jgi:lipopolysaccharide export system protein LptA
MIFHRLLLIASGLLALVAQPSLAERADRDQPMQIEADRMQHDENKQLTTFSGRVFAVKGSMNLRAERLEVRQETKGQQQAQLWAAPGQRVFFRQKREALNEYIEGEAEQLVFDHRQEVLTLSRRAEIRVLRGGQITDRIQGERIVYNQTTEVFLADGQQAQAAASDARQRVRAVLVPRTAASEVVRPGIELKATPSLQESRQP